MEPWEEFEELVKRISSTLAPEAQVARNHLAVGASGETYKLDVTLTTTMGPFPAMVVIECKRHSRRIGRRVVLAFKAMLSDIGAQTGVIVADPGFTRGAKGVSKHFNVMLLSCRDATEVDWRRVLGEQVQTRAAVYRVKQVSLRALDDEGVPLHVTPDTVLFDAAGKLHCLVKEVAERARTEAVKSHSIGDLLVTLKPNECVYVVTDRQRRQLERVLVGFQNTAWAYPIDLRFSTGVVLEDAGTGQASCSRLVSQSVSLAEVLETQPGERLTEEEFERIKDSEDWDPLPLAPLLSFSVVVTRGETGSAGNEPRK